MTKIMFHCDWGQNSEQLLDHYRWLTPEGSGKWGDLEGTTNKAEADFHIVMDGGMPDDVDPQTVIYFQREEPQVKPPELVWDNIFYQATFTDMRHHNVAVWRVKKTYDELQNLDPRGSDVKSEVISTVTSGKAWLPGHKMRLHYLHGLCEHLDIHLYGSNGVQNVSPNLNKRFKGELNYDGHCKFNGLYPYQYNLVLENSQNYNCLSEKIYDSLLCWCMPIYWGCPNIADFLPEGSYHIIDSIEDPWQKVAEIIKQPPTEDQLNAISEARQLILDRYNLWNEIESIIAGSPVQPLQEITVA